MLTRVCPKCKQEKLYNQFARDTRTSTGVSSFCLSCRAENTKNWRLRKLKENPNFYKEKYHANPESARQRVRKWYNLHKNEVKQHRYEKYYSNLEFNREKAKLWHREHKEQLKVNRFLFGYTWRRSKNHSRRPIGGFLRTQGICLFCNELNPLALQNAHVFKDDHNLLISLCGTCHYLLDHYPMALFHLC